MTKRNGNAASAPARPIKTRRDCEGASAVIKRLSSQAGRDSDAELRLQSRLREMDKLDDAEDGMGIDCAGDDDDADPRRRRSDDSTGVD